MRRMFGIHSERYSRIIELILEYHINSYNNCIRTWSSSSRFEQIFHLYSTKFYVYRIYIYIFPHNSLANNRLLWIIVRRQMPQNKWLYCLIYCFKLRARSFITDDIIKKSDSLSPTSGQLRKAKRHVFGRNNWMSGIIIKMVYNVSII